MCSQIYKIAASRRGFSAGLLAALALGLAGCAGESSEIPDLAFHRGRNAFDLERHDWARRYFEEDVRSNPDRLESLRGIGLSWVAGYEGSLTRGIEALSAYLERVPGDVEIRLALARSWLLLGERRRVLEVLEGVADSAAASELRATALEDDDPAAAERHVEAALAAEPAAFGLLLLAARLAHRRGDGALALERAQAAARADPLRDKTYYLLARIRRGLGEEDGARRDLETYEQLRRLPARGRPSRLSALEELEALRALEPRLEPSALPLRRRLARLLLRTGDPGAAAAASELVADPACGAGAVLELAGEARSRGRAQLARGLYRRALELDPELDVARAQLARLEHEIGDREEAGRLLAAGFEADPYHAPYYFVSGLLELARGHERLAIEAFTTALDLAPWNPSYRLALADVHLAAGRRDDLERLLAQAPAEDPALTAYRQRHL